MKEKVLIIIKKSPQAAICCLPERTLDRVGINIPCNWLRPVQLE